MSLAIMLLMSCLLMLNKKKLLTAEFAAFLCKEKKEQHDSINFVLAESPKQVSNNIIDE